MVRMGGRKLLNSYGRPQRGDDVQKHVEDWQILLNKFGADLMMNPEECFYRALEIIPAEFEDEIVMNPDIRTMQGVYQFVTRKTTHQKHLAQQRALIQSRTRRSPISEISPKINEVNINDIVAKTIAAVQNAQGAKPRGDKNQPRAKSPGPQPGKFWFKPDCWWCGADGHQKRDCEKYKKMLAENGGTRPKGLKGAFEKAREAWNKEHGRDRDGRSKSPRSLKPLLSDDLCSDSDDSESDLRPIGSMVCTSVFGLRCLPCDGGDLPDEEDIAEEPAHVARPRGEYIVEDVEQFLKMFALPGDGKTPQCASPDREGLKKGEVYAMMDSGAGCHAAKADEAFPSHKKRKGKRTRKCVLANGEPMESDEVVDVKVTIDGETHVIEFDDLPVECPIISVRKIVHKGNRVVFQEKGGYILNVVTRKKLHFIEKHGVYFIKIMIQPPDEDFHRPGR